MVAFNLHNKSRPNRDIGTVCDMINVCCIDSSSISTFKGSVTGSKIGIPAIPMDCTLSLLKGHVKSLCLIQDFVAPVSTRKGMLFPATHIFNWGML